MQSCQNFIMVIKFSFTVFLLWFNLEDMSVRKKNSFWRVSNLKKTQLSEDNCRNYMLEVKNCFARLNPFLLYIVTNSHQYSIEGFFLRLTICVNKLLSLLCSGEVVYKFLCRISFYCILHESSAWNVYTRSLNFPCFAKGLCASFQLKNIFYFSWWFHQE